MLSRNACLKLLIGHSLLVSDDGALRIHPYLVLGDLMRLLELSDKLYASIETRLISHHINIPRLPSTLLLLPLTNLLLHYHHLMLWYLLLSGILYLLCLILKLIIIVWAYLAIVYDFLTGPFPIHLLSGKLG